MSGRLILCFELSLEEEVGNLFGCATQRGACDLLDGRLGQNGLQSIFADSDTRPSQGSTAEKG